MPNKKRPSPVHPDCQRFLSFLREIRHYSPHTIKSYTSDLISLSTILADVAPAQVTTQHIRKLTSQLHSQQLQARSIARHLSCWRQFFDWFAQQHNIEFNPVADVKAPKRSKSLPKALSVDDAVHLVEQTLGDSPARAADHAMFELLYSSGLRVSELVNLDISYVHQPDYTSQGWIDFNERIVHVTGKGSKLREVPIGSAALVALTYWIAKRALLLKDDPRPLFITNRGTRMSTRLVQLRLKAHAQKLNLKTNVHPHVLRHSFASHLLQSSGDLRAVQELLGHASLASTQVYTALDFQHLAQVYDAAHPRAKIK